MKNTMKKAMTVCLIAALALSAFGCSKENKTEDLPVETISLEQTKQDLTFDFSKKGASSDTAETKADSTTAATTAKDGATTAAAAATTAAGSKQYEEVTQAMNVTDAEGHGVTDAAGQAVTEWVVVETRPVQNQNQPQDATEAPAARTPETQALAAQEPATDAPAPTYTPSYDTCKAYWLDMTKQGDYFFNGEFLTITFEVNKDIPDGSYPVTIATTDIASWDLVKYDPVCINGEIAVGGTPAEQEAISENDFCLKVNSQAAKQGEIVTLTIDLANNPGFCGFVIDVQYDASAMSIVEAEGGKDFDEAVNVAE